VNAWAERTGRLGQPAEIAVFRALALGDLLCTIPALRALRRAFPRARITLIGLPWAEELVRRFRAYLDAFMPFPGFPGFPEQPCDVTALPNFLQHAQERRFDLALQLHGSGTLSNPVVTMLGARHTAGYFRSGEFCPDAQRFVPWRPGEHEVHRYLSLLRELGIAADDAALEFPVTDEDRGDLRRAVEGWALDEDDYVCLHPGSQLPSRRWLAERFAAVADALAEDGLKIVLTGVAGEADLNRSVARSMRARAIDLAGKTTLGAVAALIDGAKLLVSNDTGVAHLAAARRTPSVRISCGGDERRWAPLEDDIHRVVHHPVECKPCSYGICPKGHECATGVDTERVIAAARELLAAASAARPPAGGSPAERSFARA
jgi:ADP-heptose:LPS heptosyltransferase